MDQQHRRSANRLTSRTVDGVEKGLDTSLTKIKRRREIIQTEIKVKLVFPCRSFQRIARGTHKLEVKKGASD